MKAYRLLLGFFGLALLAAVVAWLVGADPGYVLIQRAPYTVETTLVFALGAVLAAWLFLALLWWLVRWPLRAMLVRARRRGRIRFARGALALTEGRWVRAEKLLLGSSRMRSTAYRSTAWVSTSVEVSCRCIGSWARTVAVGLRR